MTKAAKRVNAGFSFADFDPVGLRRLPSPVFAADKGGGSGGESGGDPDPEAGPIHNWTIPEEHRAGLLRRIESANGNIEEALQRLWTDNADARRQAREARTDANRLRQQIEEIGAPVGGVTLTPEEAASWEAYQALGVPENIRTQIETGSTASAELVELRRIERIRRSAELAGYRPQILIDLDKATNGLAWEIATDNDGNQVAMITAGDRDPVPLTDYAAAQWAAYMPVLQDGERGTPYPVQPPTQSRPSGRSSLAADFLERTNQRTGPSRVDIAANKVVTKET